MLASSAIAQGDIHRCVILQYHLMYYEFLCNGASRGPKEITLCLRAFHRAMFSCCSNSQLISFSCCVYCQSMLVGRGWNELVLLKLSKASIRVVPLNNVKANERYDCLPNVGTIVAVLLDWLLTHFSLIWLPHNLSGKIIVKRQKFQSKFGAYRHKWQTNITLFQSV